MIHFLLTASTTPGFISALAIVPPSFPLPLPLPMPIYPTTFFFPSRCRLNRNAGVVYRVRRGVERGKPRHDAAEYRQLRCKRCHIWPLQRLRAWQGEAGCVPPRADRPWLLSGLTCPARSSPTPTFTPFPPTCHVTCCCFRGQADLDFSLPRILIRPPLGHPPSSCPTTLPNSSPTSPSPTC